MRTPITYYGGKQQMTRDILPIIPEHRTYCEPFVGGGAIFWAKEPSTFEVINDINGEISNFYRVMKSEFESLQKMIQSTLHSRDIYRRAGVVYKNPDMFNQIERAWAVWVMANMSFGASLSNSFGYDRSGTTAKKIHNKRDQFSDVYTTRLERVQIECDDALRIIDRFDEPEVFFYCDPPYPDSDQGHYDGYSNDDFRALLTRLEQIKGLFLLSSYRNKHLTEFIERNGWYSFELEKNMPMSKDNRGKKIEVLTANFKIQKPSD
jgi:Site-specific DNA methylase